MLKEPASRYSAFKPVSLTDRSWPDRALDKAPMRLSTDRRDGNQALIEPMDTDRKLCIFDTRVYFGFKEFEIGFPAAPQTEFDFVRKLARTTDSVAGARRAIIHIYNAVAPDWREARMRILWPLRSKLLFRV